ncbi:unnamed protein product [Nippostrongylus brasiliensis]|uniref:Uncharacterized protein n=1 Tax=Nippostrongylus brasiliensis TaxID=27835 RepID=A0A0N4XMH8_NIPBR|nr:unnamed protein product [Nippostrongylus brasiliensis]
MTRYIQQPRRIENFISIFKNFNSRPLMRTTAL